MLPGGNRFEVPPTAGLPLRVGDLRPLRGVDLVARLVGLTYRHDALLTCSGTAALVIALTTLARQSGRREVVVPAYTCPLVVLAIAHCGLQTRLCDTRPGHFEMDPSALQTVVSTDTLAVVPAHLGGRLADTAAAMRVAHAAGARVIEDAAQALGARHGDGTPAAAAGDIGLYSLAVGKGLSIYEGGLLIATDTSLLQCLRSTANELLGKHALWEFRRSLELLGYWALYRPLAIGVAYGMPLRRALRRGDPIAAVGDRFPAHIPLHRVGRWRQGVGARAAARLLPFLQQTRTQALQRLDRLRSLPNVQVLTDHDAEQGTWPFFMLLLPGRSSRDLAMRRLWGKGVGVSRLFIHALPDYPQLAKLVESDPVPNARDFAARSLTLSNSPWLDETRFDDIVQTLRACLTGQGE